MLEKIDETIVRTEDRASEKIDETIVRTENRILEAINETSVRTEDRMLEAIDETIARTEDRMLEAIDRVVVRARVGTGVVEVAAEGNRIYILVKQKSSITQLIRSLWSKSLLFLANSLTDIMVSFFKKIYIPL